MDSGLGGLCPFSMPIRWFGPPNPGRSTYRTSMRGRTPLRRPWRGVSPPFKQRPLRFCRGLRHPSSTWAG